LDVCDVEAEALAVETPVDELSFEVVVIVLVLVIVAPKLAS